MKTSYLIFSLLLYSLTGFPQIDSLKKSKQDAIVEKYLKRGAYKYHYLLQGWQDWIDKGLVQDSTIAYLWEMKAMPYWKTKKYEIALVYFNKAVQYDRKRNLARRGFYKCIFQKNYKEALIDLNQAENEFGYSFQSDHSLSFYKSLCYLQLNQFSKAKEILEFDVQKTISSRGEIAIHYLDQFYLGIISLELQDFDLAIENFNKSISQYSQFSDAKYYKGLCLLKQGKLKEAQEIMIEAQSDFNNKNSINEDDSFYEDFPYKVNWYMAKWVMPKSKL